SGGAAADVNPANMVRPAPRDSRQPPGHRLVTREADQAPARRRRPTIRQTPAMTAARPPATRATRGPRSIPVLARPPGEVSVDASSPPTRLSSAGASGSAGTPGTLGPS